MGKRKTILKRLLGRWKWPGWGVLSLGLVRLFHLGEDADFALTILRAHSGEIAIIASVIASPFFSLAMVAYGVLHLIFVGEPKHAVRHHGWVFLGWGIFAVCFIGVFGMAGYGLIEMHIQREVSKQDIQLQQKALSGQVFWHLTDMQKDKLGYGLDQIPENERFEIKVKCSPDTNSRIYATDLEEVLSSHHWKVSGNCLFSDIKPDLMGLYIGVSEEIKGSPDLVPSNAKKLGDLLENAGIPWQGGFLTKAQKDDFVIAIGNGPLP